MDELAVEIVEYCLDGYFSRPEDSLHSEVDPIAISCQSDTLDQGKELLGVNGLFGSQEVGEGNGRLQPLTFEVRSGGP